VDEDGVGVLDYITFLAFMLENDGYKQKDACYTVFAAFDRDGDGSISQQEMTQALWGRDTEGRIIDGPVDEFFVGVDKDDDGRISFDEFSAMFSELQAVSPKQRRKEKKATAASVGASHREHVRAAKLKSLEFTRRQNQRYEKGLKAKAEAKKARAKASVAGTAVATAADSCDIANLYDLQDFLKALDDSDESADGMEDSDGFREIMEDSDGFRELIKDHDVEVLSDNECFCKVTVTVEDTNGVCQPGTMFFPRVLADGIVQL
jgi:hypothetical protein